LILDEKKAQSIKGYTEQQLKDPN
ncbi:hypothetical protein LCGC14_2884550, partial [marine sediment metagenome]